MTAAQVEEFFARYVNAFSRFDVDEVCKLWAYPAYVAGRGKRASLTEQEFRSNTLNLCAFYRKQGMTEARKAVLEISRLTKTVTSVRTSDRILGQAGAVVLEWEHTYLLSETSDGIKVITALPDEEIAAWHARGTPMGPW